jgi:hypothetical protein
MKFIKATCPGCGASLEEIVGKCILNSCAYSELTKTHSESRA